jgi:hypothetical protein
LFFRNLFGGADVKHAGIIQQHVHAAKVSDSSVDHTGDVGFPGNIGSDDQTRIADLAREIIQFFLSAANQSHSGPFPREGESAGAADAGAGTSDDGSPVF